MTASAHDSIGSLSFCDSAFMWIKDRVAGHRSTDGSVSRPADDVRELGQYHEILLVRATRVTRDLPARVSAADLVQQTLLEAHQNLHKFRGHTKGEMIKWLDRMLSNNIADTFRWLRRQKRDISREKSFADQATSSYQNEGEWLTARDSTPSHYASNSEQAEQLEAAIELLPPEQREAVVMHHLQGQPLSHVAQNLGRSRAAVAGLVFRGLRSLRKHLGR